MDSLGSGPIEGAKAGPWSPSRPWPWRPALFGLLAASGLLAIYLGIITLAQGWSHALQQLADDRWFVGLIAAGFGIQVGVFTHLRRVHAKAASGGVAVSGGAGTVAMLACCAHHLSELLPVIGASGAAIFLELYKTPLQWLALALNIGGTLYLLHRLRQQRQMASRIRLVTPSSSS